MIEVFKTDVNDDTCANMLIALIHKTFHEYRANFDLEDCDKILRVQSGGTVQAAHLVELLRDFGFRADALVDEKEYSETKFNL